MKKIIFTLTFIAALFAGCVTVSAMDMSRSSTGVYTANGEKVSDINVNFSCTGNDDAEIQLDGTSQPDAPADNLYGICDNYEYILTYDFKSTDADDLYPDIKELYASFCMPTPGGGRGRDLGRNYKLYYIGSELAPEELTYDIISNGISFKTEKLGRYALYFDEAVYSVAFYTDFPPYTEDGNQMEPYVILNDLKADDTIKFPPIPEKSGFVFTGWKVAAGAGVIFSEPQPLTAFDNDSYYASWCEEKDYSPFEIQLTSDNALTKGEENGKTVTVKLSHGYFIKNHDDLLNTENWKLTGTDDVTIEKIEFIDNKTVSITLSGSSKELYTDSNVSVEFKNELITFESEDSDGNYVSEEKKVQLDADGVKSAWYKTNSITFNKQSRPSRGGGLVSSNSFSVRFNTNGGNTVPTQSVKRGETIKTVETPVRDGFIFDGWYTDKELTERFDADTKITSSITLYAKWTEKSADDTKPADNTKNELILTIGKKTVSVFGEEKTNDVAPLIQNGRTMLPARFVAESLGADVEWNEEKQLVTISGKNEKDEIVTIIITIGSDYASVNGEKIKLDCPAFIENERTYTPIRFISERLGAKVDWNEQKQQVTITKIIAEKE